MLHCHVVQSNICMIWEFHTIHPQPFFLLSSSYHSFMHHWKGHGLSLLGLRADESLLKNWTARKRTVFQHPDFQDLFQTNGPSKIIGTELKSNHVRKNWSQSLTQQIFRLINIDDAIAPVSFMLSAKMAMGGFKVLTIMLESVRW